MIYTVTLNPSIDYIVHVSDLRIGELNRMTQDFKLPGGKGVNVSRILQRIGSASIATGFVGGFTGRFIEDWLEKEQVNCAFVQVAEDTRINIKLKAGDETEINGLGPAISTSELTQLKELLAKTTADDLVVFSGSVPTSIPKGFYQELIHIIKQNGSDFVIDTTGRELMENLQYQPLLVKPNHHELAELYNTTFHSLEDIFPFGKKLLAAGAQHAIISMGGDGALLFIQDGIYQAPVLKGTLKNSVGAGDSMIAGFIGNFTKTNDPLEAFRWGVACGSATAFSDDLATKELINSLQEKVEITEIKF